MSEHSHLLARYQQMRPAKMELNHRLMGTLSKSEFEEGGKKLGILKKKILALDSEDEVAVLADFCIHDIRRQGINAVERYLAESPPPADSDQMVLLQALRHARFSMFVVEAVEPGVGVQLRDLLREESLFMVDIGFGSSASVDLVLATRIAAPEGIVQSTGAILPAGVLSEAKRAAFMQGVAGIVQGRDTNRMSPEEHSERTANIIRSFLKEGAAERVQYADPGQRARHDIRPPALPRPQRVGRNDPCPCGSGKKFKHCCGRNR